MKLTEEETKEIVNAYKSELIIRIVVGVFFILLFTGFAIYEYQDWKDTKQLIREHNGSCYKEGINLVCSYSEPSKTIINSNSQCFINDKEVNCSSDEFKK